MIIIKISREELATKPGLAGWEERAYRVNGRKEEAGGRNAQDIPG